MYSRLCGYTRYVWFSHVVINSLTTTLVFSWPSRQCGSIAICPRSVTTTGLWNWSLRNRNMRGWELPKHFPYLFFATSLTSVGILTIRFLHLFFSCLIHFKLRLNIFSVQAKKTINYLLASEQKDAIRSPCNFVSFSRRTVFCGRGWGEWRCRHEIKKIQFQLLKNNDDCLLSSPFKWSIIFELHEISCLLSIFVQT